LSEDGPSRPARAATLKTREYQLRVSASALVHKGVDAESIRSIADLVTLERYKLILRFLLDRHDGQSSPQIAQMAAFLKGVAKHWAKADDLTMFQMQKVASRLSIGRRGLTAKNRERLRPFDDLQTVALFLALPQRIRREVETAKIMPCVTQTACFSMFCELCTSRSRIGLRRKPPIKGGDRPTPSGAL
jgi:hypothetical protein